MNSKSDLRVYAKELRKTLDIKNISSEIVSKIRELDCYKKAKHVMIFYPIKYEIDLRPLLDDNKSFYIPKVFHRDLLVCPYDNNLTKSNFGVMEPNTEPINPEILDLIFVPALLVDNEGYRLGYGGGFYDRFLKQYPNIKTIVPIEKELMIDKLPHENFDIKISQIISQ